MKLSALLTAFKSNGVKVVLLNQDGDEIIKFYSEGYTGIEADLLAKTVKKFDIAVSRSASEAVTMNVFLLDSDPDEGTNS